MKRIIIEDLDLKNTLFHFDIRKTNIIEIDGFKPDIGNDSKNAEITPKVFFSKGIKGVLELIDVWIIWRINKDNEMKENWPKEFLSGEYLENEELLTITFSNMFDWLSKRKYYKLDLIEGIDYLENDIDEAKKSAIEEKELLKNSNRIPWRYLYAKEMYKGKIRKQGIVMEDWNMHTISNKGVEPEKISLISTLALEDDALSVVQSLYYLYDKREEFRVLGDFIKYCELRKQDNLNDKKKL